MKCNLQKKECPLRLQIYTDSENIRASKCAHIGRVKATLRGLQSYATNSNANTFNLT